MATIVQSALELNGAIRGPKEVDGCRDTQKPTEGLEFCLLQPDEADCLLRNVLKRAVLKANQKGLWPGSLDVLYILEDPWEMTSEKEVFRFKETNKLILKEFGRVDTLLEIGCGEGHQSEYLYEVCNKLVGVDTSRRAVERAQKRVFDARFLAANIDSVPIAPTGRYDLVVAFEVLYYMSDIPSALRRLSELGSNCLISFYAGRRDKITPALATISQAQTITIAIESNQWDFVWWRPHASLTNG